MGQEALNSHSAEDVITEAMFENEQSKKLDDRLKEAFRISTYERQDGKNKQIDVSEILSNQNSQILKEQIKLLPGNSHKQMEQNPIMEGLLEKQSPTVFGKWEKRYCFIQNQRFRYLKNEKKNSEQSGILNFDLLSCFIQTNIKAHKLESFVIKIQKSDKQFVFKAKSEQQTKQWAQKLKKVTNQSIGRKYNLTYLTQYHRFWRKQYLSQQDFRNHSETGDLILMRGKAKSSVLQRAITLQQFDHVAIVLKNIRHQVLLFEATGGVGVGLVPWKKFISRKWFENQQIVVYRKLNIERSEQFIEQIQTFIQRNIGRKYKFSVKKFFMNRESQDDKGDKKSYFCSSLIAKLYKQLGLLDPKLSSTQYMPSTFAQKNELELRNDGKFGKAFLERQKIIVFQNLFFDKYK